MTGKDLYRVMGQIDDSLILDANEKPAKVRRSPALWALAAAACLCLVCVGVFQRFWGTSLVWNEESGASISRFAIPEGSVPLEMTRAEAEDYYRLGAFPALLGQTLQLAEPSSFTIYTDAGGNPVYDHMEIWYGSPDGSVSAGISLERASARAMPHGGLSRIRGVPVYLTASEEVPGYPTYSARWERNGTAITVMGNGMDRSKFIALAEELLALGRKEER